MGGGNIRKGHFRGTRFFTSGVLYIEKEKNINF